MKVAIVDYGMGNLASVRRALTELGATAVIAADPARLAAVDRIVLPGVGSFADGMAQLQSGGWVDAIQRQVHEQGKPLLGICLGMQMLAQRGSEGGDTPGLGLIPGEVRHLGELGCTLRVPHVGWNSISRSSSTPAPALLAGLADGTDFYFVHSYVFKPTHATHLLAEAEYGLPLAAVVGSGHVLGTQFHPEKSSKAGFRLLQNFLSFKPC